MSVPSELVIEVKESSSSILLKIVRPSLFLVKFGHFFITTKIILATNKIMPPPELERMRIRLPSLSIFVESFGINFAWLDSIEDVVEAVVVDFEAVVVDVLVAEEYVVAVVVSSSLSKTLIF